MANKKLNAAQKREILKLLGDGMKPPQVAIKYGVSVRTIQRLVIDTKPIADDVVTAYDKPNVTVLSYDPITSENVYMRLMGLNLRAMEVTEQILLDPEARNTDKLKAASLVSRWSGLEPRADKFIHDRLADVEGRESQRIREEKYKTSRLQHYAHNYRLTTDPKYARLFYKFMTASSELKNQCNQGYTPRYLREELVEIETNIYALYADTYELENVPSRWTGDELEALLIRAARIKLEDEGDEDEGDLERV